MARKSYKYTRTPQKEGFGWWSFFVVTRQGSYKMSFKGRKEAREERIKMENLLRVRMK